METDIIEYAYIACALVNHLPFAAITSKKPVEFLERPQMVRFKPSRRMNQQMIDSSPLVALGQKEGMIMSI